MSDLSKNPILPEDYEKLPITDKLDIENMREHLKQQNCIITNSSKWARVDEDEILRIFKVNDMPRKMTDEDLKEKILETFNTTTDPLSVEALKQQFPNFPDTWYEYVSKSAIEKITLIKQEEEVKKKDGFFNISFK